MIFIWIRITFLLGACYLFLGHEEAAFIQLFIIDFIGASFGITPALLSFWLAAEMKVTRIGFTKDKASGEHSVMVLKTINADMQGHLNQLSSEFYRSFDFLLFGFSTS